MPCVVFLPLDMCWLSDLVHVGSSVLPEWASMLQTESGQAGAGVEHQAE